MNSTHPRRTILRTAAVGIAAGATAACSGETPADRMPTAAPEVGPGRHEVRLHDDARVTALDPDADPTVAASAALLARSTAVLVSSPAPEAVSRGSALARTLRIPLLVSGPALLEELDRLGARTVVEVTAPAEGGGSATPLPSPGPTSFGDREVIEAGPTGTPEVPGLPAAAPEGTPIVASAPGVPVPPALDALLEVVGAERVALAGTDPRADPADADRIRAAADSLVLGVGALGPHFAQRVRTVRTAEQLPGGGVLPFPARRMVALYGHPSTAALGMLGEQSIPRTVQRVRRLAREYESLVEEEILPAFELIATVATGAPGASGTYTQRTPRSVLEPWVRAAAEADIYVVLDLQPGRESFLTQAKAYQSLLVQPHVGLALDPEWRLGPQEKPLQRIGHVEIEEVNETGRWLAALVRDRDLPPKVLTLHQFRTSMIRGRERLDTSLDEIQWLVHADGQGQQGAKQETWSALRKDLPDGVWLGWKNFEDEDLPMLTPAQTVDQVDPTPSFISYQ